MLYFILKYTHVLGAIVVLGTGAGIAFFMLMAHRGAIVSFASGSRSAFRVLAPGSAGQDRAGDRPDAGRAGAAGGAMRGEPTRWPDDGVILYDGVCVLCSGGAP